MELGNPGLIIKPVKYQTGIARLRVAIPVQLRTVEKLLEPTIMGLHETASLGQKLSEDPRNEKYYRTSQLAKALAAYDISDPGAARVVIVTASDFNGTSPKFYWPETLVYMLPGAELNQILTLVVAMKSETPCEPELLLFAGMNDHLH